MMKYILIFCLVFSWQALLPEDYAAAAGKQVYSTVRLHFNDKFNEQVIMPFGLDMECTKINPGVWAETILPLDEVKQLLDNNIRVDIIIPDMEAYYLERYKKFDFNGIQADDDFKYGSMGGFFTLSEMYAEYNELTSNYPQYFLEADTIGYSVENNPIVAYKFGSGEADLPEILVTNLIHAREPGGMMVTLYFLKRAFRMAEEGNEEFKYLLENRTIFVIPAINPDGYLYNEKNSPEGGGLWRKNTRKTTDSTLGVDLNRNFGPYDFWNSINLGSSPDPLRDTYRGAFPFSEPETQALRKFAMKHNFNLVVNNHTYGGYIVHPYSALGVQTADSAVFRKLCAEFSKANKYSYGLDLETVGYGVRGDSDDWFYTEDSLKKKIFSITPEIGNQMDGFWPSYERLPEQCRETFEMNLQMLWSAGYNIRIKDCEPVCNPDSLKSFIKLSAINAGVLEAAEESQLRIKSLNGAFVINDNARVISKLAPAEIRAELFEVSLAGKPFVNGIEAPFEVTIIQDGIERTDTFNIKMFLYEELWLLKNGEFAQKWNSDMDDTWDFVYDPALMKFVLTDSPKGLSRDTSNILLEISEPLNIGCNGAVLAFDGRWTVESYYDKFIIQAKSEGSEWSNLVTDRMTQGIGVDNSRIDSLEWAISGNQPEWIRQECDLSPYINEDFYLRFGVLTDRAKAFDGVYLDNIRIKYYRDLNFLGLIEGKENLNVSISPNPVRKGSRLLLESDSFCGDITIVIIDVTGRELMKGSYQTAGDKISVDLPSVQAGVYFARVYSGKSIKSLKIVVAE